MTEFRINVVVDPRLGEAGIARVEQRLTSLDRQANKTQLLLARAFTFAGIGFAVAQLTQLGDAFTNLQNRLRVVTNGQQDLANVTEQLLQVANESRSSFESTAELYSRLALATRELNLEGVNLAKITESINKAIILSGASAKEANNGLIQLSQGLASGRLTGDELRSTLEQLPVVADVIAKQLGVTRGELRKLGAAGLITSEQIIKAFQNAEAEIEQNFSKTVPTLSQSFVVLRNNVVAFVGELNEGTGTLRGIGAAIRFVGTNIETLSRSLVVLSTTLLALKVAPAVKSFLDLSAAIKAGTAVRLGSVAAINQQNAYLAQNAAANFAAARAELKRTDAILLEIELESIVNATRLGGNALLFERAVLEKKLAPLHAQRTAQLAALVAAEQAEAAASLAASTKVTTLSLAFGKAKAAVIGLTRAIAANPIGAFLVVATAIITALVAFRNEIRLTEGGLATLGDLFTEFFAQLGDALGIIPILFDTAFGGAFRAVGDFIREFNFSFSSLLTGPALVADRMIGLFLGLFNTIVAIFKRLPSVIGSVFVELVNGVIQGIEFLPDVFIGLLKTIGQVASIFISGQIRAFQLLGQAAGAALRGSFGEAADLAKEAGEETSRAFDVATSDLGGRLARNIAGEVDKEMIPRLKNTFETGFTDLGQVALNAFSDGANFTQVRDFVSGLLAGAEIRAAERAATEEIEKRIVIDRQAAAAAAERAASLKEILAPLQRESELLGIAAEFGQREADTQQKLLTVRDKLAESSIELSAAENLYLELLVRSNVAASENLSTAERLAPVQDKLAERTRLANQAFAAGAINAAQYAKELRDVDLAAAESSRTIGAGLKLGIAEVENQIGDLNSATANAVTTLYSQSLNALNEFVAEGELDIKNFGSTVLKTIGQVVSQLLILRAIQGIGGFFGGSAGGGGFFDSLAGFGQQRAVGGAVQANQPYLVGEEGPEIIIPGQTGSVTPTDQTLNALSNGAASGQTVIVQAPQPQAPVINNVIVDDPRKVPAGIQSEEGRQAIRNVIRQERTGIKRDLA